MQEKRIRERKKEGEFPLRTDGVLTLKQGKKIPVVISCRADGACVVLPRSMKEIVFPGSVEGGKKTKRK